MARIMPIDRRFFALIAVCGFAHAAQPVTSHAQDRPGQTTYAVVTADNVLVRSGAADSYYPFGRLSRGALVEVMGEKFNWNRVATRGPAFGPGTGQGEFFGHIIYPQSETGRFRVNPDGKTGVTLGRMDVLAPNLNTNFNPNDSWKPLIRLEPDTTVRILSTTSASNNTVHLIVLPADSEGWVSKAHLREATSEEVAAWRRATSPQSAAPAAEQKEQPKPAAQPAPEKAREQRPAPVEREEVVRVEPVVADSVQKTLDAAPAQQVLAREETPAPAPEPEKGAMAQVSQATNEQKKPIVEEVAKITMEDLEVLLVKLRNASAEIAEIGNLRQMYLEFGVRNSNDRSAAAFAKGRAEQLEIWRAVRQRQMEIARIRERSRLTAERAEMALLSIHAHADYDAIGRLTASTIYDGQRLPRMLRLQEPGTNRTLAYIEPEGHGFEMIEMIGLWLGVVGEKSYDPALRLNIITPKRIDLLAPTQ